MFGDVYNVKDRIRSIDNELDMEYQGEGNYIITHKGGYFMGVRKEELNQRLVDRVRKIVWTNNHKDMLEEIDKNNQKLEESKQRRNEDMVQAMADDLYPYIQKL
jgi:hypothetical protein